MSANVPMLLVSGLSTSLLVNDLCALVAAAPTGADLVLAASPPTGGLGGVECLDLTAILDEAAVVAACRAAASLQCSRVFVRDHQLGYKRIVEALNEEKLRSVVLYTAISYDTDVAWVLGALTDLSALTKVDMFALDLFCDVEDSWDFFNHHTGEDEFGPRELRQMCERFPVLITADLRPENARDMASFPGVKGLLLACDALTPKVPAERHVLSFDTIPSILAVWPPDPNPDLRAV